MGRYLESNDKRGENEKTLGQIWVEFDQQL